MRALADAKCGCVKPFGYMGSLGWRRLRLGVDAKASDGLCGLGLGTGYCQLIEKRLNLFFVSS